jgi:hypothetical protein
VAEHRPTRPRRFAAPALVGAALVAAVVHFAESDHAASAAERDAVGPGKVSVTRTVDPFALRLSIDPNRAGARNSVSLQVRAHGKSVRRAQVSVTFTMPAMAMGEMRFKLTEKRAGVYRYTGPAPTMSGAWRLVFLVKAASGLARTLTVEDRVA